MPAPVNILPFVPSDPHYTFDTTIVDEQVFFEVRWNERDSAWYFDMYDANGGPMALGVKVVLGAYLGRQSPHPWFSENVLAAIDTTLSNVDPGFDDLGTRVLIQHYTADTLLAELTFV